MSAKSAFFANVSHELKTPMTLVVTPLENTMRRVPIFNSVTPLMQEKGLKFEFVVGPPPGYAGKQKGKEGEK